MGSGVLILQFALLVNTGFTSPILLSVSQTTGFSYFTLLSIKVGIAGLSVACTRHCRAGEIGIGILPEFSLASGPLPLLACYGKGLLTLPRFA